MSLTAPYTDPDGHPSHQPDERVRARDAWHRRLSAARDRKRQARALAVAAEVIAGACGTAVTVGHALEMLDAAYAQAVTEFDAVSEARP